jgi:hypothetical protein
MLRDAAASRPAHRPRRALPHRIVLRSSATPTHATVLRASERLGPSPLRTFAPERPKPAGTLAYAHAPARARVEGTTFTTSAGGRSGEISTCSMSGGHASMVIEHGSRPQSRSQVGKVDTPLPRPPGGRRGVSPSNAVRHCEHWRRLALVTAAGSNVGKPTHSGSICFWSLELSGRDAVWRVAFDCAAPLPPRSRTHFRIVSRMARDDPSATAMKESNRRLRETVGECRRLLRLTQQLIERARRVGGPPGVR